MERAEKAAGYFAGGLNCAQSVFLAYAEEHGVASVLATRVATGLGGGMGRAAETCGAVSGAVLAIGLVLGQEDPADRAAKERCYAATREFITRFLARNGTIVCRELLGCDIGTEEGMQYLRDHGLVQTHCARFVRDAVEILDGLLASHNGSGS